MASKAENEKKIIEMRKQGYNDAEIADMMATDAEIDRGKPLFELADELKAGAKKARQAERKANAKPRVKKEDEDRRFLIDYFVKALINEVHYSLTDVTCVNAQKVEVTNPERELTFEYNERKYRLTLAVPRK